MKFKKWMWPILAIWLIFQVAFVVSTYAAIDASEKIYILVGKIDKATSLFTSNVSAKGTVFSVKTDPLSLYWKKGLDSISFTGKTPVYDFISINAALGMSGPYIFEKTGIESGTPTAVTDPSFAVNVITRCDEAGFWFCPQFYGHGGDGGAYLTGHMGNPRNCKNLGSCNDSFSGSLVCVRLSTAEVKDLFLNKIPEWEAQPMWLGSYGRNASSSTRTTYRDRMRSWALDAGYPHGNVYQCYGGTAASQDDLFPCIVPPPVSAPDKCSYWLDKDSDGRPDKKLFVKIKVVNGDTYYTFFPVKNSHGDKAWFVLSAEVKKVNLDVNCFLLAGDGTGATYDSGISSKVKGIKIKSGFGAATECDKCATSNDPARDAGEIGTQVALTVDNDGNTYYLGLNGGTSTIFRNGSPWSGTVKILKPGLSFESASGSDVPKKANRLFSIYNSAGSDWILGTLHKAAVGSTFAGKGGWIFMLEDPNKISGGYYDASTNSWKFKNSTGVSIGDPKAIGAKVVDVATDGRGNLYLIVLRYEAIDSSGNQKVHLEVWKYKNQRVINWNLNANPDSKIDLGVIKINHYSPSAASTANISSYGTSWPPEYISSSLHSNFDDNNYMPIISVTFLSPPRYPDEISGSEDIGVISGGSASEITIGGQDYFQLAIPVGNDVTIGLENPPKEDDANPMLNANHKELGVDLNSDGNISALPNTAIVKKVDITSDGVPDFWSIAFRYEIYYREKDKTIKLADVYCTPTTYTTAGAKSSKTMQWVVQFYNPSTGAPQGGPIVNSTVKKNGTNTSDPTAPGELEGISWTSSAPNPLSIQVKDAIASQLSVKFLKGGIYEIRGFVEYLKLDTNAINNYLNTNVGTTIATLNSQIYSQIKSLIRYVDGKSSTTGTVPSPAFVKLVSKPLDHRILVKVGYDVYPTPPYIENMKLTYTGPNPVDEDTDIGGKFIIEFDMQMVAGEGTVLTSNYTSWTKVKPGIGCFAYKDFRDGKGIKMSSITAQPNNYAGLWQANDKRNDGTPGPYGTNGGGTSVYDQESRVNDLQGKDRYIVHWFLVFTPILSNAGLISTDPANKIMFSEYQVEQFTKGKMGTSVGCWEGWKSKGSAMDPSAPMILYGDLRDAQITAGSQNGKFHVKITVDGPFRFLVPGQYIVRFGLVYPTLKWVDGSEGTYKNLVPDKIMIADPDLYSNASSWFGTNKVQQISLSDENGTNPSGQVLITVNDKTPPELIKFDVADNMTTGDIYPGPVTIRIRENYVDYMPPTNFVPTIGFFTSNDPSFSSSSYDNPPAKIDQPDYFVDYGGKKWVSVIQTVGGIATQEAIKMALFDGTMNKPNPYNHYIWREFEWTYRYTGGATGVGGGKSFRFGDKDRVAYVTAGLQFNGLKLGDTIGDPNGTIDINSSIQSKSLYKSTFVDWDRRGTPPVGTITIDPNTYPSLPTLVPGTREVKKLGWKPLIRKFTVYDNDPAAFGIKFFSYASMKSVSIEVKFGSSARDIFEYDGSAIPEKRDLLGKVTIRTIGAIGPNWTDITSYSSEVIEPDPAMEPLFVGSSWGAYTSAGGTVEESIDLTDTTETDTLIPADVLLFVRYAKTRVEIPADAFEDNITTFTDVQTGAEHASISVKFIPANVFRIYNPYISAKAYYMTVLPVATCEIGTIEVKAVDKQGNVRRVFVPFKVVPALQQNTIYNIQGGRNSR